MLSAVQPSTSHPGLYGSGDFRMVQVNFVCELQLQNKKPTDACTGVCTSGVTTKSGGTIVVPVRLELTTLGLLDPRSNQLSYETWLMQYPAQ